jgi:hypothetical protein
MQACVLDMSNLKVTVAADCLLTFICSNLVCCQEMWKLEIQECNIAGGSVWVWNLVSDTKGGI